MCVYVCVYLCISSPYSIYQWYFSWNGCMRYPQKPCNQVPESIQPREVDSVIPAKHTDLGRERSSSRYPSVSIKGIPVHTDNLPGVKIQVVALVSIFSPRQNLGGDGYGCICSFLFLAKSEFFCLYHTLPLNFMKP